MKRKETEKKIIQLKNTMTELKNSVEHLIAV